MRKPLLPFSSQQLSSRIPPLGYKPLGLPKMPNKDTGISFMSFTRAGFRDMAVYDAIASTEDRGEWDRGLTRESHCHHDWDRGKGGAATRQRKPVERHAVKDGGITGSAGSGHYHITQGITDEGWHGITGTKFRELGAADPDDHRKRAQEQVPTSISFVCRIPRSGGPLSNCHV